MHKRHLARVVLGLAIFIAILLFISHVKADSPSPWITSALSSQKQAETTVLPSSLNGNIDCAIEDNVNCAVPTSYGDATQNSTISLNGGSDYRPVISYTDNHQHFLPVPNSGEFITYTTDAAYGLYLYFNYSFSSSASLMNNGLGPYYQIISSPDGKLADKANHRLAADYGSMSFSQNGEWMLVSDPNVAMLRVNLRTFEVLPFAAGFNYTIGLDPAVKTAITNDGHYAVVASREFNRFKIYDLSTCEMVPDTIGGPVACQSRDLDGFMRQQVDGYQFISNARFIDDSNLAIYATYNSGSVNKTARFIISTGVIGAQLQYLALGDSYIVGEGAFDYQAGSDTADNKCHSSLLAYPYLIGHDLNYNSYHSAACSGAVTADIADLLIPSAGHKSQAKGKADATYDDSIYSNFLPGYRAQLNFVSRYQPRVIMVSVGGNDMGFSGIVQDCATSIGACYSTYEDRLELVNQINNIVFPRLVQTYQQIKAASPPDSRLYVIGYPQIAKPGGDCGLNVRLNSDEVQFSQQLINYLDATIQVAANKAGVYYVDAQDALNGHRLCEASPGSVAMNGLTAGNNIPDKLGGPIGNESYHPNPFGYQLLENKILAATHNLTNPMPAANPTAIIPVQATLDFLNAQHRGRAINSVEYDQGLSNDLAYRDVPVDVTINGAEHSLAPGSSLQAEVHSSPINLGSYSTDSTGNLSVQITIPSSVPAGYHSLHFYGMDIAGQKIDIYKYIYVASTVDDLDSDGVMDSTQKCIGIPASSQDYDQDGIDDACDGNITLPPTRPTNIEVSGNVSASSGLALASTQTSANPSSGSSTVSSTQVSSSPGGSGQPVVLGAATTINSSNPKPKDNLQIPKSYYAGAGLFTFLISGLAYAAKTRLF